MKRNLLLGCGNSRQKKVAYNGAAEWGGELVTLDMNPKCGADIEWNLDDRPLPFKPEEFDEVHAYDVLEHTGRQGDWQGFFREFEDYWRILKPGGLLCLILPVNRDALADPGHTRFFSTTQLCFLNQDFYANNLGEGRCITDYRWFYKKNFNVLHLEENEHHIGVVLQKA